MEKLPLEILVAIISGSSSIIVLTLQIIIDFIKNIKKKQYEGVSEEFTTAKSELQAKVEALREAVKAQRVCVNVFHNGGQYYTGESIKKISIISEAVESGISTIREESQNVPISAHLRNIIPLFYSDYVFEKNTQTKGDMLSHIYDSINVKTCMCIPIFKKRPWYHIRNYSKRMLAVIQVVWKDETELTDEIKNLIMYHKDTIDVSLIDISSKK